MTVVDIHIDCGKWRTSIFVESLLAFASLRFWEIEERFNNYPGREVKGDGSGGEFDSCDRRMGETNTRR